MRDTVISVKDLCKDFGSFHAVDHITFEVRRGEIFGFLGANGAGKTTAMRMLCGLSYPTSGSGTVAGFDVMTQGEAIKCHIGYMSQRFSLYEDLTVWENIRLYAGIYGLTRRQTLRRAAELLARLQFRSEIHTRVGSLPLGWKQKLAFSVATLHRPEVVFLDEPTGGVDPLTRRQFWELIYRAASEGTTVFVTTHYMDEAEYCSRVSVMVDGRIRALGTPAELKKQFDARDDGPGVPSSGARKQNGGNSVMGGFGSFVRKEALHILRDPRTMLIVLLMPGGTDAALRLCHFDRGEQHRLCRRGSQAFRGDPPAGGADVVQRLFYFSGLHPL